MNLPCSQQVFVYAIQVLGFVHWRCASPVYVVAGVLSQCSGRMFVCDLTRQGMTESFICLCAHQSMAERANWVKAYLYTQAGDETAERGQRFR